MKILFIGAHPDDAEIRAGGLMLKNRAAAGRSKIITLTNGNCGVVGKTGVSAAAVRKEEMQRVKDLYGFETNAIVTMEEVVEHLYNKEYKGKIIIDDKLKSAIDAYYEQYGAKR